MELQQQSKAENEPFVQLLILGGLIIGGIILTSVAALVIGVLFHGTALLSNPGLIASTAPEHIFSLKIQLIVQQLLIFLAPALLLALIEKQRIKQFYGTRQQSNNVLLIVLLIMVCSFPIMGWVNEMNQKMALPSFLKGIEKWMREMEDMGAETTKAILKVNSFVGFLFNLFVIAVVPAVCEEFLFRGALQRTFMRLIANPHVAIWLSAIVFSTIHFQFFGFFPRMLLGAGFGYIYWWTGSLKYTIFAHFLNNGFAVCISYYLQLKNLPLEKADEMGANWIIYIFSAVLTLALFKYLKDQTKLNASSNNA